MTDNRYAPAATLRRLTGRTPTTLPATSGGSCRGPLPGYLDWSKYGKCVYLSNPFADETPFHRVRASDRKLERLVKLGATTGGLPMARSAGGPAPGPDQSLLTARYIEASGKSAPPTPP
jgi:hypothetical protein